MLISYNWLQSYFSAKGGSASGGKSKLPKPEKLAELLTMHSFEVKGFSKVELQGSKSDFVFDIDILPNRAHDCLSHYGVAREIAALLKIKIAGNLPSSPSDIALAKSMRAGITVKKGNDSRRQNSQLLVSVKEPELCRRYIGRIIENVKVKQSPRWLKEKLETIGQKSINNIVDAANYVMFDLGQPLHTFDTDKIKGGIVVKYSSRGEKITTLDNQKVEIDKNVLVIADNSPAGEPLAIAGIKGGKKAEVDEKTTNIILEAANFEPINIRKTSRRLGIRTESSVRFENEISQELAEEAMERLTALILEISGGKAGEIVDKYPKKMNLYKISLSSENVTKLLGVEIKEKKIIDILEWLGFGIKKTKGIFTVTVPHSRLDVRIKEDLIEEIGRVYGYEKIKSVLPVGMLIPPKRNVGYLLAEKVKEILVGAGFSEVYNYSFADRGKIELQNPIAKDKKYLRTDLLKGLNQNIKENLKYFKEVRVFEIGKIFPKEGERTVLAGMISGRNFYEAKGVVEMILEKIGVMDIWFDDEGAGIAEIKIDSKTVGIIDHGGWEIDFEMLTRLTQEEAEYSPISKYPSIARDISLFVPPKTKVVEVLDVIENTAGKLLYDTDLFDIYDNGEKKSFAFRLIFQSSEKTLSDDEVNKIRDKIIKALEQNPDWEVRR